MLRNCGLSLVLFTIFILLAVFQTIVGHQDMNEDLRQHDLSRIPYIDYLQSGICWESLSENWESEFLEMGAFVWLTSFLFQRGSPQSHDPDKPSEDERPLNKNSPWFARKGGWLRALYARSLSLSFLLLFFLVLSIHAVSGASEFNRQQQMHGSHSVTVLQFLGSSRFWFQSLQNWQSEFLGIGMMVLLSIWLRQKGSAESKPVNASHQENE